MWNILSGKPSQVGLFEPQTAIIFPLGSHLEADSGTPSFTETTLRREVRQIEARLEKGEKACHKVRNGRVAWVQLLSGYADVNGETLSAGDGVSFNARCHVLIRALDTVDFVIFDMAREE